ncbi:SDR family NAD(P)-dependent oxidoreductase [Thiosulfativibrio zosterae]|uniref:Short-chain dehydrogenase n=1 Tax=Thiosulfativibrio zosterae TaxID=2675053 RepID=A0A6F8PM80_9GAMM|nr:SDR family NAD(P)-dependent oxidoreductase [Thiosulfativibrio zosterae]BBP43178.1 short-chain dehydrogenase [Thiosulfativibrio zosterae]
MKTTQLTNPQISGRRIWLVGGSEGIGLAMTQQLLGANHQLVVSARAAEQHEALLTLQQNYPTQLFLLNLDVTQKDDLPAKIDQAWSFLGGFDAWIYNAGAYIPMTIDEWNVDAFEQMNAINYLGAVYIMHGLLPKFKAQAAGELSPQWLWNISLAGDFGLPYGGGYSAPKAALQNLAESLYPELKQAGIALKVVNHGFVQTRLTAKNDFAMLGLMTPEAAATKIIAALDSHKFEHRFPWNLAWVLGTIKRLPKSWALKITQGMLKK